MPLPNELNAISTLPNDLFYKFPELETAEIHLATDFQNMIYDNEQFPKDFKEEIYAHLRKKFASDKKEIDTDEQFIYKTRKKGFGEFKSKFWNLSEEIRTKIGIHLQKKVEHLFTQLKVENTIEITKKTTPLVKIPPILEQEIASA